MATPIGHERQVTFFKDGGHNHDGENSSPVEILPGAISLFQLNPQLIEWIRSNAGSGGGGGSVDTGVMPVPDLEFQTPPIAPGASYSDSVPWTGMCFVRFMRVLMTQNTECTITFYHSPTFADEDREFRATRCSNKFLWEGAWAHFDESEEKQIHYRIQNTGNTSSVFKILIKSGTMAANVYARFVEGINIGGSEYTGTVQLNAGNGIQFTEEGNGVGISAVSPETIYTSRWSLSPTKPVGFSSSNGTITNQAVLSDGSEGVASFGNNHQWIMADLGATKKLGRIVVKQPSALGGVWKDVRIETSVDGSNWSNVKDPSDVWGSSEGISAELPTGRNVRYIRVWCNGSSVSTLNSISKIIPFVLSNNG